MNTQKELAEYIKVSRYTNSIKLDKNYYKLLEKQNTNIEFITFENDKEAFKNLILESCVEAYKSGKSKVTTLIERPKKEEDSEFYLEMKKIIPNLPLIIGGVDVTIDDITFKKDDEVTVITTIYVVD